MQSDLRAFLDSWTSNARYFEMLRLLSSLSKLFSESSTPYLDYRLAENLFCKYYHAQNDARACTAYDARLSSLGIGIKTFIINRGASTEKIAEFNKLKPRLSGLKGLDLARELGRFRNERIEFARNTYDVTEAIYHIVGRQEGCLRIFNSPYDKVCVESIADVVDKEASISFHDGLHEYSFNKSKSVLQRRFVLPSEYKDIPVEILDEPLELLASLLTGALSPMSGEGAKTFAPERRGYDYVILPLYSTREKEPIVPEKSGLNQWNAAGRRRNANEIYIPIPRSIHKNYPNFFPSRDCPFELILPDGRSLSAKVCQENGKALMSNPNSALGEWMLRKVLHKAEGELLTMDDLYRYGIDSVKVLNTHRTNGDGEAVYKIVFSNSDYEDYATFREGTD